MTNARDLSNRLAALLRNERHAMADFLLALADFDRRAAWRELGHATLFSFLRRELRLSAGAAQYRKTAAELVQRFPEVERALRSGDLCLSSIVEVAKVLTPANVGQVLPRFFGLSRREAADVAVSIRPVEHAPAREVVTALRPAAPSTELAFRPAETNAAPEPRRTEVAFEVRPAEVAASRAPPSSTVEPLDAGRVRLHLTVSRRLLAKLAAAKDALSHARPGASSEEILEAALDALLAARAKRNGLVEKPRKTAREATAAAGPVATAAGSASARVPDAVRREAWLRAGGRCEFRFPSGERCDATARLQLDHVTPRALGGPSTIDNARVLCQGHNLLEARRVLGDACVERRLRKPPLCAAP